MPPKLPGHSPDRCQSPHVGSPTGYRLHVERRKKEPSHLICAACREAIRLHHQDYRKRRILNGAKLVTGTRVLEGGTFFVDVTGTRRRLQGLAAIGYSFTDLAGRLGGIEHQNFTSLVGKRKLVYPETEEKIKALYNELSMFPPAENREVKFVRTNSAKKGWLPPLAWDDDDIDNPHAIPQSLTRMQAYHWFWHGATTTERIEWVLEHGLAATRSPKDQLAKSARR